ncbi:hypothetical protein BL254_23365 [Protofrankia sp. BMG5.30]|nr:hypothetical protein BL254_23365 [Protofrankia sp. BMG5.30]
MAAATALSLAVGGGTIVTAPVGAPVPVATRRRLRRRFETSGAGSRTGHAPGRAATTLLGIAAWRPAGTAGSGRPPRPARLTSTGEVSRGT